jgi:hypothetical protein
MYKKLKSHKISPRLQRLGRPLLKTKTCEWFYYTNMLYMQGHFKKENETLHLLAIEALIHCGRYTILKA